MASSPGCIIGLDMGYLVTYKVFPEGMPEDCWEFVKFRMPDNAGEMDEWLDAKYGYLHWQQLDVQEEENLSSPEP